MLACLTDRERESFGLRPRPQSAIRLPANVRPESLPGGVTTTFPREKCVVCRADSDGNHSQCLSVRGRMWAGMSS